eukprot:gnl/TRDRNA2_/TRDRNA2_58528_c1_seq1.p1 gnl/TRDRNA2_/TRDRNA2_58528_c1~~gnl/TRDRNA2_/TRDRNA2_58528_c1_seq1.p1  ORF type:complete len:912 (-),score=151.71 gnl/TRDRNA2_/TRDRNA2_58528_c1_seq1:14-2614(-)
MAIVAVGDFEGDIVVSTIAELFDIAPEAIEPLPRHPDAPERPKHAVPDSEGVTVASSTDPELSFAQGIVDCKRPRRSSKSVDGFRRNLCEDLFHKALASRLLKLTVQPRGTRNFFMVGTETGEPVPPLNPMTIQIAPLPGRMRPAIAEICREIERVKRLGFHDPEVRRAQRAHLAEFEQGYIERDQQSSESLAEEYVAFFLDEQPAPGITASARLVAKVLPSITAEEVSRVGDEFNFDRNVVVKIATPPMSIRNPMYTCWSLFQACKSFRLPRPSLDLPGSSEMASLMREAHAETLEPWPVDADDPETRLQTTFEACVAGRDLATGSNHSLGATRTVFAPGVPRPSRDGASTTVSEDEAQQELGEELVLENGLRLFLKDTELFDDEIVVRCRRWGGLTEHQSCSSLSRGAVSCEAHVCSMVAMMLGICGLSVESLQECLDGRRVDPSLPEPDTYTTTLAVNTSPVDLEVLLTLLHLLFVCPVEPKKASRGRLSLVKLGLLAWRLGENRDPEAKFRRRVAGCTTGEHPFVQPPSLWSILRLNFTKASMLFNELVSRPSEWTFVIVGRLPAKEKLRPLLQRYLGSIPSERSASCAPVGAVQRKSETEARAAVTPVDINFPNKSVREQVHLKMVDPKGSTVLCFPITLSSIVQLGSLQSAEDQLKELFVIRLVRRMLETRLVEVLRFQRGQVYGVSVAEGFEYSPPQLGSPCKGTLSITFSSDPAEADDLVQATTAELQKLRDGTAAFEEEHVASAREQERREFEENFRQNTWWAEVILDLYFSRGQAVTGEIGATVAFWWRVRSAAVEGLNAEGAMEALRKILPDNAASAIITMRPKGGSARKEESATSQDDVQVPGVGPKSESELGT